MAEKPKGKPKGKAAADAQGKKRKAPAAEGGSAKKAKKNFKGGDKHKGYKKKSTKKAFVPPSTKKEKRALKQSREKEKPHYETVKKANEVWKCFEEEVNKADRIAKITEILDGITGKIDMVAGKHHVSRAVQHLIKHGTKDQKRRIFTELKEGLVSLSMHRHGHFIVIALLKCNVEDVRKGVFETLLAKAVKLALHNTSAPVIDYMYASGLASERLRILAQFYGTDYSLFTTDNTKPRALGAILAELPERKTAILANIQRHINKCATKDLFMFRPLHGLIAAYMRHATPPEQELLVTQLSQKALALHHSQDGAWLVCECLAQGSAKVRKTIMKSLKGRVVDLATNEYGCLILVRALDVVDDTVLLNSTILNELKPTAAELLLDPNASKVLLFLVSPARGGSFTEHERAALQPALKEGQPTSRKPAPLRRCDLLARSLGWLLDACEPQLAELLVDKVGSKVLYETLREASTVTHPSYAEADAAGPSLDALVKMRPRVEATLDALAAVFQEEENHALFADVTGHYTLKRLLVHTQPDGQYFATQLLASVRDALPTLARDRGSFVICAMLEKGGDAVKTTITEILTPHLPTLQKEDKAGPKLLVKLLTPASANKVTKKKVAKTPAKSKAPAKTPAKKLKASSSTPKASGKKAKKK